MNVKPYRGPPERVRSANGTRIHTIGTVKTELYLQGGVRIEHEVLVAKDALHPTSKPFFVITRIQVSFTWEDLKLMI